MVLLALVPVAAAAQTEHRIRVQGTWSTATDEAREADEDGDITIGLDDAVGGRLAYEVPFARRWGVELGVGTATHDVTLETGGESFEPAELRVAPLTASLLYHLTPGSRADFFVGGGLAYVDYGDYEITLGGSQGVSFPVDADLTYTLQAGIDGSIDERWGWTAGLQWIDAEADVRVENDGVTETETLPIAPLVAGAGLVFRF
jgi:outer membrane protein W